MTSSGSSRGSAFMVARPASRAPPSLVITSEGYRLRTTNKAALIGSAHAKNA